MFALVDANSFYCSCEQAWRPDLDGLNNRHGRGSLFFAGQGIQQKWQMKRNMLSPRWTTRISDVPQVN